MVRRHQVDVSVMFQHANGRDQRAVLNAAAPVNGNLVKEARVFSCACGTYNGNSYVYDEKKGSSPTASVTYAVAPFAPACNTVIIRVPTTSKGKTQKGKQPHSFSQ
mmetsp:Transcript_28942/g.56812  ORF Transcript_28942/g.56812 Transcript_28942/m.56812 type:complete len:106 (+) Transcript_28942:917-1234(+)